jgi:hypothetical protein
MKGETLIRLQWLSRELCNSLVWIFLSPHGRRCAQEIRDIVAAEKARTVTRKAKEAGGGTDNA